MKIISLLMALCGTLGAQSFTTAVYGNSGVTPLSGSYAFASTPEGNATSALFQITNSGARPVEVVMVYVASPSDPLAVTPNFTVTGFYQNSTLAAGSAHAQSFNVNFTPTGTGSFAGSLLLVYLDPSSGESNTITLATLSGSGTAPQTLLTYNNGSGFTPLLPARTARLDFGNVSTSGSATIQFTLTNQTSSPLPTPSISVQSGVYSSSAFALNTSALPSTLPANGAGTFSITFAPGETGLKTATLVVGNNSFGIQGAGVVVNPIDALTITYLDPSGTIRSSPEAATPISFGQLVPGTAGGNTLRFTVTNPQTSFSAVTVSTLSVTGGAFTLSSVPALPAAIQPGASISFGVTFSAAASATYTGTLSIGGRVFNLTGLAVVLPVPQLSLQLSQSTLASGQQIDATVQAASASTQDAIGQISMQFTPAVANVTDDPAVMFLATGGRNLSLELAKGAQSATYEGQPSLSFQTGSTAGTLSLTLAFPNTAPITQSYVITPAAIHIASAQAVRSDPNLIITVTGLDNTYSAGKLSFTFYDGKGNAINSTPITADASGDFHQYFFGSHTTGGTFSLQAKFPVKGDITQIGAVAVTLSNSAGDESTKILFN